MHHFPQIPISNLRTRLQYKWKKSNRPGTGRFFVTTDSDNDEADFSEKPGGVRCYPSLTGFVPGFGRPIKAPYDKLIITFTCVIRLVNHLSGINLFGTKKPMKLVVDADSMDGYRKKEKELISDFKHQFGLPATDSVLDKIDGGIVQWVDRGYPRKFGNVLEGEVEACQQVAQQIGISGDPVYTLAAWELAMHLSQISNDATEVVMLHTGGTLGIFGLISAEV
ncbi:hypothetical protein QQ045_015672 [Rhodiola kirilowii]